MKRPPRRAASATVPPTTRNNGPSRGGSGQTAAVSLLHDDQDELDHRELADQVEAIRALLQLLRALVLQNVPCDRLSQTVGEEESV